MKAIRTPYDEILRMQELQLVMSDFERAIAPYMEAANQHAGNALLNLSLARLIEQHGRECTAALLARIVEELWSNTLPDSPDRALDVFRLDA